MKDKKKHINQKPDGKYPEPGVPADGAWADMKAMLDLQMPETEQAAPEGTKPSVLKLWMAIPLIIIGIMLCFLYFNKNEKANLSRETKETSKQTRPSLIDKRESGKTDLSGKYPSNRSALSHLPNSESSMGSGKNVDSILSINPEKFIGSKKTSMSSRAENVSNIEISKNGYELKRNSKLKKNFKERITSSPGRAQRNENPLSENHDNLQAGIQNYNSEKKSFSSGSTNRKLSPAGFSTLSDNNITVQKIEASRSAIFLSPNYLHIRPVHWNNNLNATFIKLKIIDFGLNKTTSPSNFPVARKENSLFRNFHFGMHWSALVTGKENDHYFTGANGKQQVYFPFIPGLWISKSLKNNGEILIKASINQYFGNNNRLDSSSIQLQDSARNRINTSLNLIKVSGINAGLQYNQHLTKRWSLGLGANVQYQQRALLQSTTIRTGSGVIADSLIGIKGTANQFKYLNPYFISVYPGLGYSLGDLKIGAAAIFPLTNMARDKKSKPVSGQIFLRWKIK
ncbi:hypothetical protein [Dyadobacter psychrotolerans]|uniref:Uncharacterized protein n=1 Tax=Dyadobacter psychrotolerans TaxID=2541721 RepID=A0A4R5E0Q9_9BACT|nr:hypothetical protein [Dyadobacter psychrotolerans]TDE18490.1 hypothetical protein E0F88_02840 [Dyadobacter psychrotolerans]